MGMTRLYLCSITAYLHEQTCASGLLWLYQQERPEAGVGDPGLGGPPGRG